MDKGADYRDYRDYKVFYSESPKGHFENFCGYLSTQTKKQMDKWKRGELSIMQRKNWKNWDDLVWRKGPSKKATTKLAIFYAYWAQKRKKLC